MAWVDEPGELPTHSRRSVADWEPTGDYDKRMFKKALNFTLIGMHHYPTAYEFPDLLGSFRMLEADYLSARDAWERALALNPLFGPLYTRLADCYEWMGQQELAQRHRQRSLLFGPEGDRRSCR
uniref:Tetratricopeptide repeat protein n=1 Tax=Haptolina ericina TaxID=156174 RepID=A0A7S3AQ20_9EUKA